MSKTTDAAKLAELTGVSVNPDDFTGSELRTLLHLFESDPEQVCATLREAVTAHAEQEQPGENNEPATGESPLQDAPPDAAPTGPSGAEESALDAPAAPEPTTPFARPLTTLPGYTGGAVPGLASPPPPPTTTVTPAPTATQGAEEGDDEPEAVVDTSSGETVTVRVNAEMRAYGGTFTDPDNPKRPSIGAEYVSVARTEFVETKLRTGELERQGE